MDADFDIDLGIEAMDVEVDYNEPPPPHTTDDIVTGEEQEPGEIDDTLDAAHVTADDTIAPNKVYLCGLDTFNPHDVKAYVAAHIGTGQFERIEWINDSAANLVFATELAARDALVALAAVDILDPTQLPPFQLLPAKPYAAKPECVPQLRFSVTRDKKPANAAAMSRFYLLNPKYDPAERDRRRREAGRYRERDDHVRNRNGDRRNMQRSPYDDDSEIERFDVNFYDDDTNQHPPSTWRPQRATSASRSAIESDGPAGRLCVHANRNQHKELFPDISSHRRRSRDRSASPPRSFGRARDDQRSDADARGNWSTRQRSPVRNGGRKELFPSKVSSSVNGTAQMDLIKHQTRPISVSTPTAAAPIDVKPRASTKDATGSTFQLRGKANQRGLDRGFTIKGTAVSARELFPEKLGPNSGKELFANGLEGRGRRRQKAEDMFHGA